jgi:hypothetical protein
MAGFDKVDPANLCCLCGAARADRLAETVERTFSFIEKCRRALDEGIAVVEECVLHGLVGVMAKVRVLIS